MTKINRAQLRQMINETMGDSMAGEELPEPLAKGTFEIRPEPLGGDIIGANQGVVLTLSGMNGISTTYLSKEDLRRGTFVIDISDIVAMDMPK